MRTIKSFSLLAAIMSFGAIATAAGTAQAAPCCSAPICQAEPPSPWCALCNPNCVEEELELSPLDDPSYDEGEAVCLNNPEAAPSETDDAAPAVEDLAHAS